MSKSSGSWPWHGRHAISVKRKRASSSGGATGWRRRKIANRGLTCGFALVLFAPETLPAVSPCADNSSRLIARFDPAILGVAQPIRWDCQSCPATFSDRDRPSSSVCCGSILLTFELAVMGISVTGSFLFFKSNTVCHFHSSFNAKIDFFFQIFPPFFFFYIKEFFFYYYYWWLKSNTDVQVSPLVTHFRCRYWPRWLGPFVRVNSDPAAVGVTSATSPDRSMSWHRQLGETFDRTCTTNCVCVCAQYTYIYIYTEAYY